MHRALICLLACAFIAGCGGESPAPPTEPTDDAAAEAPAPDHLTRALLDRSLELGRGYLLRSQRRAGNFVYEQHIITGQASVDDESVRQVGTLWGLALIHLDNPSPETAAGVARGIAYFNDSARETREGARYVVYEQEAVGRTGGVALLCLALIETLRSNPPANRAERLQDDLARYLRFLVSLRMPDGRFHGSYRVKDGRGTGAPSPYFDGESLLAMVKAAKYAGHTGLRDLAIESAEAMYRANVEQPLAADLHNDTTKGFYQWGTMAFHELYASGWEGTKPYAERALRLAEWMIDTHDVLHKDRNTAYAYEGLAHAWELARLTGKEAAMKKIRPVIEEGLFKLISWQIGAPNRNAFLRRRNTHERVLGGVLNEADALGLRIDVTQHQVHAVMLTRRFLYR